MASIKRGIKYLFHSRMKFLDSVLKNFGFFLPDKVYLALRYRFNMGKKINWKEPVTFGEKINWLKLYNRKPEYTKMVDKCAVKDYVSQKIGSQYIIPTLGVWSKPEDIEWDKLPDQFVLKTTNGGGSNGVVICTDKSIFNRDLAVKKLRNGLKSNIYKSLREWPYKNVKKQIIAEKYMSPKHSIASGDLADYKFYCFNGEPIYCQVIRDRHSNETIDFFDMEWKHQDFVGLNPKCRNGKTLVEKPQHFSDMIGICRELSIGIPFVRVDLYSIESNVYFGELTFYPASGFGHFSPNEWNTTLGNLIQIPDVYGKQ